MTKVKTSCGVTEPNAFSFDSFPIQVMMKPQKLGLLHWIRNMPGGGSRTLFSDYSGVNEKARDEWSKIKYLRNTKPVISLLHGLPGIVHRLGLVPGIPVWTKTCRKKKKHLIHFFAGIAIDSMKKKKFYFRNSNTLVLLVITTNPRMDLFKHLCIQCNKKCPLIMIPSFM